MERTTRIDSGGTPVRAERKRSEQRELTAQALRRRRAAGVSVRYARSVLRYKVTTATNQLSLTHQSGAQA